MRASAAARRYARALFALAQEEGSVEATGEELTGLRQLIDDNRELRDALMTPLHPAAERKGVISGLAGRLSLSQTVLRFFHFLIDQRRLVDLSSIQEEFERLANEATGLLRADVVFAAPIDERHQDRLRRALSQHTGREVQLDSSIDPTLIGGAIAKVGGLVFDGSVRSQLARLGRSLAKEA